MEAAEPAGDTIYRARAGVRIRTSVQAVGERIEEIRAEAGDGFTLAMIVEDAQRPESPLHGEFADLIDDPEKCVRMALLGRARRLADGVVRVVVRGGRPAEVLQSVRVVQVRKMPDGELVRESRWMKPEDAFSREDWREQVRAEVQRQIAGLEGRLRRINESEEVIRALAGAREALERAARPAEKGRKRRAKPRLQGAAP